MDKTFEIEVVRIEHGNETHVAAIVRRLDDGVSLTITDGLISNHAHFLPSEAVTIGEQLIAAGKAGEV